MLIKYGKGTKKFRFPVDLHLKQAVGALTLHTGETTAISYRCNDLTSIKNARYIWQASACLLRNVRHRKCTTSFQNAK